MVISRETLFPPVAVSQPSIDNYMVKQSEISNYFYNFNLHIVVEKGKFSIVRKSTGQTISS